MARLSDDGTTVELDLHGEGVADALALARRALALCAQRGRRRLRLVHGASTSAPGVWTIRSALHDWLDSGSARAFYVSDERAEATLTLHLDLAARPDPRRLTLRDVR